MDISRLKTRSRSSLAASFAVTLVVLVRACVAAPPDTDPPVNENLAQLRQEWCQHWSMESRIAQAQLVLVARVSSISVVNIVHGAKVNTTLRDTVFNPYRF